MSDVLLVTVVTPSHRAFLNEFFVATLPSNFSEGDNFFICELGSEYDNAHSNVELLKKFERERLQKISDVLRENEGKFAFFVDADVCFASNINIEEDISNLLEDKDILFQRNGKWPYNFGVFAFRCNSIIGDFFDDILENHFKNIMNNGFLHDQHVVNELLNPGVSKRVRTKPVSLDLSRNYEHIRHDCLPLRYFANGESLSEPPFLIHSIGVQGIGGKRKMLANFKRNHYDNK